MEKLTIKIMNSFEDFLEAYDTCSKSEVIYNWSALKKEIEKILEDVEADRKVLTGTGYICPQCKEDLGVKKITEQIIKCDCGVKYYMDECGILIPVTETETNSWQDGNIRKWKCGCDSVMACESSEDRVITCGICYRKYAWDSKMKRMTYISETGRGEGDTSGFEVDHALAWKIAVEAKDRLGIK